MANRVTDTEVRAIMSIPASLNIDAFITGANLLVTDKLTGQGLSDEILKEIERWVSAHFVASLEQISSTEKLGEGMDKYWGYSGKMFESTPYGQRALALDSSGKLKEVGKRKANIETLI